MSIKAIIFDYYDVLLLGGLKGFLADNKVDFNSPGITATNDLLDSNKITLGEYWQRYSKVVGLPAEDLIAANVRELNAPLLSFIKQKLAGRYKLAIVSNVHEEAAITGRLSREELAVFEYIGMSFRTGFQKPDQRAYLDAADRLGVKPAECVFVDDRPQYCAGAESVGMKAVLYTDLEKLKKQLEDLSISNSEAK